MKSNSNLKSYFKKYHFGLFLMFFALGVFWGKFFYYSDRQPLEVFVKRELKVLSPIETLSDDVLESYHLQHQTQISITNYNTKDEFRESIQKSKFDIIIGSSEISKELLLQEKISPLENMKIKNKQFISADFSSLPYDKDLNFFIPLFWGIHGINITIHENQKVDVQVDPEGATLWTTNIGILKNSQNINLAHEFIDFLLQKEIVLALVEHQKVATTQKELDQENIQAHLKASFIRKVSLKDFKR